MLRSKLEGSLCSMRPCLKLRERNRERQRQERRGSVLRVSRRQESGSPKAVLFNPPTHAANPVTSESSPAIYWEPNDLHHFKETGTSLFLLVFPDDQFASQINKRIYLMTAFQIFRETY